MNPDQTAPLVVDLSRSIMFAVKATKVFKQRKEPMTIVMTGRKGLIMELTGNEKRNSTHYANRTFCAFIRTYGLIIIRLFYYLDMYSIIISELLLWFSLILNFCGLETHYGIHSICKKVLHSISQAFIRSHLFPG